MVTQQKLALTIFNHGINGQTVHFKRICKHLSGRFTLHVIPSPLEVGFLQWIKRIRNSLRNGIKTQIHIPSAAFMLPILICMSSLSNKPEFLIQGRLINKMPTWSQICYFPLFFLPRLIINRKIWVKLVQLFFPSDHSITYCSKAQHAELLECGISNKNLKRLLTAPLGVELIKSEWNKSNKLKICFIGHDTPIKGLETLLKALNTPELFAARNLWELEIAIGLEGNYQIHESFARIVSFPYENIRFLGKVDATAFIQEANILILPYTHDFGTMHYPVTLTDSMQLGVIPIISNIGGLSELTNDTELLEAFTPSKSTELASKLLELILMSKEQLNLKQKKLQNYSQSIWGKTWKQQLEKVYDS